MRTVSLLALLLPCSSLSAEDIIRETFDQSVGAESLKHTWGDAPAAIAVNKVEQGIGPDRSAAAHLKAVYPLKVEHNLSYWSYSLAEHVPLVPQVETISFDVKTNVPVSIKIGIAPFGFIYHGPDVDAGTDWQRVTLRNAYEELKKWCATGNKTAEKGWVSDIIVAVQDKAGVTAEVVVDNIAIEGPPGAARAVKAETLARRTRRVRIAPISLIWDQHPTMKPLATRDQGDGGRASCPPAGGTPAPHFSDQGYRTLDNVLSALDEAGSLKADLACLPEECVHQPPEPIPGPASNAIAAKANQHHMLVVGNLRERDGDKTYVTSFLCGRDGRIIGKYRKSHRMPYETDIALGDDLPVLETDIGPVGLKIGTDQYFPEIDTVLARRGATLIVWSTSPMPVRDEHTETLTIQGRAVQNAVYYAVARYAGKQGYGGYRDSFSWTGTWPLGRAQVFDPDGHTVADSGHAGGVALASVPAARLEGTPHDGGYATTRMFSAITAPRPPAAQPRTPGMTRVIRAAAIECDGNIDRLIGKLDDCGRQGCDIVCLWEYVWYNNDEEVVKFQQRNRGWLARIADAAKRHKMYIVIGGELDRGFNESILYDRQGREIGRYTKINQTTDKKSKYYKAGDKVGIFDLDFGRVCTKICADVYAHEIDRVAALHQVDLVLHHSQDAGPFVEHTRFREARRCLDDGYFLLRATSPVNQTDHRTYIMDPWGMVLAASQFGAENTPVVATINLDNRPKYYEWPEAIRKRGPYPDPRQENLSPQPKGDLRAVILAQRRPELYLPKASQSQR
jgi:predicted amidohydrolase